MQYFTKEDLSLNVSPDVLLRLTDDNQDGNPDDEVIDAIIAQVSSYIDMMLCSRFQVPLTSPPQMLIMMAINLALPLLFSRRGENVPEGYLIAKEQAEKFFGEVKKGDIQFGNLASKLLPQSTTLGKAKHFGADQLGGC